jgi:hypothetical protein
LVLVRGWGAVRAVARLVLSQLAIMTKTHETISEAVRDSKHVFAKAENHTKKSSRHRYERRKAREYLTLTDWLFGEAD